MVAQGETGKMFRAKSEALAFGFVVPFFFVASGINLDLASLLRSTKSMMMLPIFLFLLLLVRGTPVFLYRRDLPKWEWLPFALYSATALPMVVAIADIGVRSGRLPAGHSGRPGGSRAAVGFALSHNRRRPVDETRSGRARCHFVTSRRNSNCLASQNKAV